MAWRGAGEAYLEKADEVAQHHAVDARQRVHHGHGGLRALVVRDALLVELVRDQRLFQFPVPQLQQRRCGRARLRWACSGDPWAKHPWGAVARAVWKGVPLTKVGWTGPRPQKHSGTQAPGFSSGGMGAVAAKSEELCSCWSWLGMGWAALDVLDRGAQRTEGDCSVFRRMSGNGWEDIVSLGAVGQGWVSEVEERVMRMQPTAELD